MARRHQRSLKNELQAIEELVRLEEEAVLQELHSDREQTHRLEDLRSKTQEVFSTYDSSRTRLLQLEQDLRPLALNRDKDKEGASSAADLLARVRRRIAHIDKVQPIREQIVRELSIAVELTKSLTDVGSHRDYVIMHAIKGLANTKALHAGGELPKEEVFERLRAVTSETQALSVSHTNIRVRQGHCLRVVTRLMSDVPAIESLDLEDVARELLSGSMQLQNDNESVSMNAT
eukprot:gene3975-6431_t